jgi:hypothetical protein
MSAVHEAASRSSAWPWLIAGTLLLIASSALALFAYRDTAGQFPIPMYPAVFYLFMPYGSLFVVPLAFWGSFGFLWESKRFGVLVLSIATVVAFLDGLWLAASWDDGYRYQGSTLTLSIALANTVALVAVAALSTIGLCKRSKTITATAYFVLFEALVLFAFPDFGSHELS